MKVLIGMMSALLAAFIAVSPASAGGQTVFSEHLYFKFRYWPKSTDKSALNCWMRPIERFDAPVMYSRKKHGMVAFPAPSTRLYSASAQRVILVRVQAHSIDNITINFPQYYYLTNGVGGTLSDASISLDLLEVADGIRQHIFVNTEDDKLVVDTSAIPDNVAFEFILRLRGEFFLDGQELQGMEPGDKLTFPVLINCNGRESEGQDREENGIIESK